MRTPTCNYRGTTFGAKCGKEGYVQLVGTARELDQEKFHTACREHAAELSREYPKALFWEFE